MRLPMKQALRLVKSTKAASALPGSHTSQPEATGPDSTMGVAVDLLASGPHVTPQPHRRAGPASGMAAGKGQHGDRAPPKPMGAIMPSLADRVPHLRSAMKRSISVQNLPSLEVLQDRWQTDQEGKETAQQAAILAASVRSRRSRARASAGRHARQSLSPMGSRSPRRLTDGVTLAAQSLGGLPADDGEPAATLAAAGALQAAASPAQVTACLKQSAGLLRGRPAGFVVGGSASAASTGVDELELELSSIGGEEIYSDDSDFRDDDEDSEMEDGEEDPRFAALLQRVNGLIKSAGEDKTQRFTESMVRSKKRSHLDFLSLPQGVQLGFGAALGIMDFGRPRKRRAWSADRLNELSSQIDMGSVLAAIPVGAPSPADSESSATQGFTF